MKPIITIIFICMLICFGGTAFAYVVDHNCTDITQIPESAINTAKTNLHIAYGHTSHGSQLISGMGTNQASSNQLDNFLSNSTVYQTTPGLFIWHDGPVAGALDLDDYAMGGDVGYYPQWVNNTESYLGNPNPNTGRGTSHPDVNVIIWSWCGQAAGKTEQGMIDTYLAPMTQLEIKYPGITFVYMTGHLNGTGETGNLHLRNEQIRAYCNANNKVLYDFADIESYDPDGLVNYMVLNAEDDCDYDSDGNGSRDKNWADDWQNSHTQDVHWWASGAAHSKHLNGNLKGYAAWWLWARIAGWDGGTGSDVEAPTVPQSLTVTAASQSQIDPAWAPSTDNLGVTGYRIFRNGTEIATTASTTYNDTGLNASTTYSYTVTAYDEAGNESSQSDSASAATQASSGSNSGTGCFIKTTMDKLAAILL